MRSPARLLPHTAVALGALGLAACAQILGADDFRVSDGAGDAGGDGGAAAPDAIPILPALPDPGRRDGCEQCARDRCEELWKACRDEPSCLQMLRCKGKCDDPDCLLACGDVYPESRDFDDYWECVYGDEGQCVEACGPGRNFECAGRYSWEPGEDNRITVDLTVRNLGQGVTGGNDRVSGTKVRICRKVSCDGAGLLASAKHTDAAGRVRFTYRTRADESPTFVEISETPERDRCVHYGAPVLRNARREVSFLGRRLRLWDRRQPGLDDSRSVIFVEMRDCLGTPAPDIDITLDGGDEETLRAVDVRNFRDDLTGGDGRVTFYNVPVGETREVAVKAFRGLESELAVAKRRVGVRRDGWWTFVELYPYRSGDSRAGR